MSTTKRHLRISPDDPPDLQAGREALGRGAWAVACEALQRVVESGVPDEVAAEAWAGIGLAAYWLEEPQRSQKAHERAMALYRAMDRYAEAARMALWLADVHQTFFGAAAVANGLIERAERLLEQAPPGPGHAWLPVYRGHHALMVGRDPRAGLDRAREALELARELAVPEADVVARALEGLALVALGEVEDGMARLDEASAAAMSGGLSDLNAIAWACCYLISACDDVRDIGRAADWCRRVMSFCEEWGLRPVFLSCRTRYASILTWQGRWDAAESELLGALSDAARVSPPLERAGAARLGELRRRQGAFEEADAAFRRAGEHPLALLGEAALALDRAEPELALDLARRLLRRVSAHDATARADVLLLLVRAATTTGDLEGATQAVRELDGHGDRVGTDALLAGRALARAFLRRARSDHEDALEAFEEAVGRYDAGGAPFEAAEARLELARTLRGLGRRRTAVREARLAWETFRELGARARAREAGELLDELEGAAGDRSEPGPGSGAARPGGEPLPLTDREVEILGLVARGLTNDEIARELVISPHTVKRHISNVLVKLGESSRAAAVARATRAGML